MTTAKPEEKKVEEKKKEQSFRNVVLSLVSWGKKAVIRK